MGPIIREIIGPIIKEIMGPIIREIMGPIIREIMGPMRILVVPIRGNKIHTVSFKNQ